MPVMRKSIKKVRLTRKRADIAVKRAKARFKVRARKGPRSWKKGGKEWSRVLGHFGLPE